SQQFFNVDFADAVLKEVFDTGFSPSNLQLELTETILMNDVKETIATLNKLKKAGISLAMDDFGTGYSSLSYLNRLPVDTLKIDRSFVMDLESNRENAAICAAIIAMAHALNLQVVAEGVETEGQKNYLKNQRCDQIQGYLISKPLPGETLENAFLINTKNPTLIPNT
ncbi:MAG: EAL domain-containing protein, partial [Gammaproteobacteria bacterium]|nr:EAL domain-containing protein [Gammaproteobacteria bacterium]